LTHNPCIFACAFGKTHIFQAAPGHQCTKAEKEGEKEEFAEGDQIKKDNRQATQPTQ
jgi:hypothetical protein